jgi:hypothetical protein
MSQVKQEISTIDVVNVAIVAVSPGRWPGIDEHKRVAAVLELRPPAHYFWTGHGKVMLSSELGAEAIVWNATAVTFRASMIVGPGRFLPCRLLASGFLLSRSRFFTRLLVVLLLFLLVRPRRLRFILLWGFHFILFGCRLGFILFSCRLSLVLLLWLFLLRFVFLWFFVLCVKNRRARDQCRENS